MSNKTLMTQFEPSDFRSDDHLWDTFSHNETEVSAGWVLRFLQERGDGWRDFTVGEIREFYRCERASVGQRGDGFTFNRLIPGCHAYSSARGSELRDNVVAIDVQGSGPYGSLARADVCTVTERFILPLLRTGLHKAKRESA